MSGLDHYQEALNEFRNLSPLEKLEARLAYLELLEECRKQNPEDLRAVYEEAKRFFA